MFDIVLNIIIKLDEDSIRNRYCTGGSNEYHELAIAKFNLLLYFLAAERNSAIDVLAPMLHLAELMRIQEFV